MTKVTLYYLSKQFRRFAFLLVCLVVWPGQAVGEVKGTATYRERLALPRNAVFEATLEDVSKTDAPAEVIGQARIEQPGNPPIRFEITYDQARIISSHRYAVRARILVGGKPFFITDRSYPVLTVGQGNEVALLLRLAGPSGPIGATEPLENTYWKLTRLGDAAVTLGAQQREPHLILNPKSRSVGGSGGCNRLMGSYELNGDMLTFGRMATTKMACTQRMETEKAFLESLGRVRMWKIAEQHLEVFDAAGKLVARFEARHMK